MEMSDFLCSLFYVDDSTAADVQRIVLQASQNANLQREKDIRPSDKVTVITGKAPGLFAEDMRWGFIPRQGSQLIINARAESALEKVSFRDSVGRRRCVIPARQFYEWDKSKTKATFTCPQNATIYMAGFYNCFDGEERFVILTTKANASMEKIHDRMPLILPENEIKRWIFDDCAAEKYLSQPSPMLTRYQEFEQLILF